MKILLIIVSILFIGFSCKSNKTSSNDYKVYSQVNNRTLSENKFEIIKIDSIENIYLIYAKKRDSIFKIATDKIRDSDCKKIKKNEFYELEIKSIFSPNFHQKLDITGFKFSGTLIKFGDEGTVWDLFSCKNFKGLCYDSIARSPKSKDK
jgi:hypothetical protein